MPEVLRSIRLVGIVVGRTYVPWRDESLALFGLNGVGKTRFLDAVESLCSSRFVPKGSASLIVQMGPAGTVSPDALKSGSWHLATDDMLCEYLEQVDGLLAMASEFEVDDEMVEEAYRRTLTRFLLTVPQATSSELPPDWWRLNDAQTALILTEEGEGLLSDMLKQRMFEVRPGGAGIEVRPFVVVDWERRHVQRHVLRAERAVLASVAEHGEDQADLFREFSPLDLADLETLEGVRVQAGPYQPSNWTTLSGTLRRRLGVSCIDIDAVDQKRLTAWTQEALRAEVRDHASLVEFAAVLSERATAAFQRCLGTSVELLLAVPSATALMTGSHVEWRAAPAIGRNWKSGERVILQTLPLDQLSFAEKRWAVVAVLSALGKLAKVSVVLMDEPEHGLPRNAEATVAANLMRLTVRQGAWLCIASHSPAFLSARDVTAVKVSRPREGVRHLAKLGDLERSTLLDMGLTPLDVLSTRKGFLLVEGAHDELVLQELIGPELSELGVELVPLRGGRKLPGSIESQVIFDYTEAKAFAMLDATAMASFAAAWDLARATLASAGLEPAKEAILREIPDAGSRDEELWLRTWLIRAMERDLDARVVPLGVNRADIIEYLPVKTLVEGAASWEELREQHSAAVDSGKANTPKDFKRWLERAKGSDFSLESLRSACRSMDHIPSDVTDVLVRIREQTQ